ncbi:hypothetical protein HKX48_008807 [Thoreauomyces humboldtii]|nr:hypothetical protein HKX48_008807 [Thoreauomyces humboldtii]
MISSLVWVRQGAAQETPDRFKMTDDEFAKVAGKIGAQLDDARDGLTEANGGGAADDDGEEDAEAMAVDGPETAPAPKSADDDELAEYNMDNYDDDSDPEEAAAAAAGEGAAIPLFSKVQGLTYHGSNEEDPYVSVLDQEDEDEELREMVVMPHDNLLLAAKTEDDISHLEVYLYEGDDEDNLYVHHDIMLPSFPLCLEWLDFRVGAKADQDGTGNYVAIGTFDPQVEIWDLDLVDAVYPECILGGTGPNAAAEPAMEAGAGGKKKKKKFGPGRVAKAANPDRHVDAVMAIAWNPAARHLVATGSADTTVKLWDLRSPEKAVRSFTQHTDKVQAVSWNPAEPTVLLTGGYDKRCCVFDTRAPAAVREWKLTADVECIKWDPFHPGRFFVSTEDGLVQCFDASVSGSPALFTLHAHDAAVSALDVSSKIEGLLVTGSTDKKVKVWNIKDGRPSCIISRDLDLVSGSPIPCRTSPNRSFFNCADLLHVAGSPQGKIFAATFSPDAPFAIAAAGSKGKVLVWNLEDNAGVRRTFPVPQHNGDHQQQRPARPPRKEITAVESDGEGEDDDEEVGQGADEGMDVDGEDVEEEEGSDDDHV